MKLYYVANARLPTEKAHGIQLAKMCEAFVAQGIEVVVVAPRRKTVSQSMQEYYRLSEPVRLVRLPVPDWYTKGRAGFAVSSFLFMLATFLYLWGKRLSGERFRLYTVDMDTFSFSMLRLLGRPCIIEVHNKLPSTPLTRFFFAGKTGVVAINEQVKEALRSAFSILEERITIEPNGVDLKAFSLDLSQEDARRLLGVPPGPVALYVGRIYAWKELGILADAAALLPGVLVYLVGGTREEFMRLTGRTALPESLHFVPEVAPVEVPQWLAAADTLLILGSQKNENSFRYTAPMKVFEYMAARRPVVASATPALTGILGSDEAVWYEPDNARDLAHKISQALAEGAPLAQKAYLRAQEHDWQSRARRILNFFLYA